MSPSPVVLRNVRLVDGTGAPPVPDGVLVVDGPVIRWCGPAQQMPDDPALREATGVDLAGRTVCPGFIDAHVHFALPGPVENPLTGAGELVTYRTLKVIERLRTTLHNGVTTARDLMGLDAGFRRAVAERRIAGPRLLVAVSMLSQTAGHADFRLPGGVDALAAAVAFPGSPPGIVDTVDDIRVRVRALVAAGADCIKLAASGGVTSPHDQPDWLGLRPEMIRAAVEEADAYGGLPVAVHAIGEPGIAAAVHGGVRSVEHGYALTDELGAVMVERGQFLVPTLLETMATPDPAQVPPAVHAKAERWHRIAQESVARSVDAGIRVAMGTDAGLIAPHGQNLKELGLLVRIGGMTPLQAIRAATADAAELCGVGDITGSLVAGKAADIVVCGRDPLADIDGLATPSLIHAVIKEGRIAIDRAGVLAGAGLPGLTP
ncbi:amidohydrolase family protein [Streptomyces sp. UH6]|uniref:metal-dependent hydrolase family protein n=1 Tax=Streptomyces sp. UH6 TaxID=2748379 RepID=UPI0015D4ACD3|nr:amidohydrolase family protein [Streptomyces sp. UH6]NYV74358.1 amidohydrolase family protein [Streptomyces sp. UH6]